MFQILDTHKKNGRMFIWQNICCQSASFLVFASARMNIDIDIFTSPFGHCFPEKLEEIVDGVRLFPSKESRGQM